MAQKPFQFRLASLVWLVVGSAVVFGVIRFTTSSAPSRIEQTIRDNISLALRAFGVSPRVSDDFAVALLVLPFTFAPIILLFFRRHRGGPRRAARGPNEGRPAAPLRERLSQFISNVAYIEPPSESAGPSIVLPESLDGKPARSRDDISGPLGRIREAVAASPKHDAK